MAINLGSTAIKNVMLGTTQVKKVMLGTNQVWSNTIVINIPLVNTGQFGTGASTWSNSIYTQTTDIGSVTGKTVTINGTFTITNGMINGQTKTINKTITLVAGQSVLVDSYEESVNIPYQHHSVSAALRAWYYADGGLYFIVNGNAYQEDTSYRSSVEASFSGTCTIT